MILKNNLLIQIKSAKKGEQTAYNYLLNLYWNDVFLFLKSKIINDELDAEDITIVAFSKAFDKIETFDENKSFKSWLLTIAKNLWIDELRKHKKIMVSLEEEDYKVNSIFDDNPSPEDIIIIEQNLAALKANIKRLKPKYQEIIHLRYFQELSYIEIANHLKEPINNVKVKILRAKKLLAEIITRQNGN